MKLQDFICSQESNLKYFPPYMRFGLQDFMKAHNICEFDVDDGLLHFIRLFDGEHDITTEEITSLKRKIEALPGPIQDTLALILCSLALKAYTKYTHDILSSISMVEQKVNEGLFVFSETRQIPYQSLLNAYRIIPHLRISINLGIPQSEEDTLYTNIPFAINALRLAGKLSMEGSFHELDLSKPIYPIKLEILNREKLLSRKGIKDSDKYFPYKKVVKTGVDGDENAAQRNFMATDGEKIFFLRGVPVEMSHSVFGSKIATIISREYFSSERLLDNHLVASRKFNRFSASIGEPLILKEIEKLIEDELYCFPGTGIIEEVLRFVDESDLSVGNFGVSSSSLKEAHLAKIDFDGCSFKAHIEPLDYERKLFNGYSFFGEKMLSHVRGYALLNMSHKPDSFMGFGIIELLDNHNGYVLCGSSLYYIDSDKFSFIHPSSEKYDDLCTIISRLDYEKLKIASNEELEVIDVVTKRRHTKLNAIYLREKLITRLKLSLLTSEILTAIANKAYSIDEEKAVAVSEAVSRSQIVHESLINEGSLLREGLIHLLAENPYVINELAQEIITYVNEHFEDDVRDNIVRSINEKKIYINEKISSNLGSISEEPSSMAAVL